MSSSQSEPVTRADATIGSRVAQSPLSDAFARRITYLRVSVTDRCDLRCRYCMAEKMTFLPRHELLSLEELAHLAEAFVARGVRKVRLTGGEPLTRRGIGGLVERLGAMLGRGLDELTLTTNGTRLAEHADGLHRAGIRRVNVSLDTLNAARFRHITRLGDLGTVLDGIAAASEAGLRVKINMVALAGWNDDEIEPMLRWCAGRGHDLTLIETMPMGETGEDRTDRYLPLDGVREDLARRYRLEPIAFSSGGPARYVHVADLNVRLGFITPLTANFCAGCNRVRVTAEGKLHTCLGYDDAVDLRTPLRDGGRGALDLAMDIALLKKPERHAFTIGREAVSGPRRHMSVTGG